jgi:hypothetical protein
MSFLTFLVESPENNFTAHTGIMDDIDSLLDEVQPVMTDQKTSLTHSLLAQPITSAANSEQYISLADLSLPFAVVIASERLSPQNHNIPVAQSDVTSRLTDRLTDTTPQPLNNILTAQPNMPSSAPGGRRYKERRNLTRWDSAYYPKTVYYKSHCIADFEPFLGTLRAPL